MMLALRDRMQYNLAIVLPACQRAMCLGRLMQRKGTIDRWTQQLTCHEVEHDTYFFLCGRGRPDDRRFLAKEVDHIEAGQFSGVAAAHDHASARREAGGALREHIPTDMFEYEICAPAVGEVAHRLREVLPAIIHRRIGAIGRSE